MTATLGSSRRAAPGRNYNASFDRSVLLACCARYRLRAPRTPFTCTVQLARAKWGILCGESLDAVSRAVGVEIYRLEAWKARRARAQCRKRGDGPARRGPTPALSDAQLLVAIRTDLARSPFQGEGHRKVHARLRILDGIRVSRTRVLRVMRAQGLLSPHRGRQGDPKAHDGTIVTSVPCVMWGTDGIRVFTAEDGWVWTFAAIPAPQGFLGHLIAREFSQEECRDGEARSGIGGGGSP